MLPLTSTVSVSLQLLEGAAWQIPIVRAFNQGSLRPRVVRAQGIASLPLFPLFLSLLLPPVLEGGWSRLPSTARIGRAPFHRARPASKEGTWPLLFARSSSVSIMQGSSLRA